MAGLSQREIARLAGVDQSAVSHALRGTGTLSQATRQRILQICQDRHYRPNAHAQTLRTAESRLIGVITGQLHESFHAQLLHELTSAFAPHHYQLMFRYPADRQDHQARKNQILSLLDRQAAGVVVASYTADLQDEIQQLVSAGIALVMAGFTTDVAPGVACHRYQGGQLAAEHLYSLDRRRPATLMDPHHNIEGRRDKKYGFADVWQAHGIPTDHWPMDIHVNPFEAGARAAQQWLAMPQPRPDAFFCHSDDVAIGLMRVLLDHGVRLPDQLAIVGFDDTPNAAYAPLPLTTVHQPFATIAHRACQRLLTQIRQHRDSNDHGSSDPASAEATLPTPGLPEHDILPARLIIRQSTGKG